MSIKAFCLAQTLKLNMAEGLQAHLRVICKYMNNNWLLQRTLYLFSSTWLPFDYSTCTDDSKTGGRLFDSKSIWSARLNKKESALQPSLCITILILLSSAPILIGAQSLSDGEWEKHHGDTVREAMRKPLLPPGRTWENYSCKSPHIRTYLKS